MVHTEITFLPLQRIHHLHTLSLDLGSGSPTAVSERPRCGHTGITINPTAMAVLPTVIRDAVLLENRCVPVENSLTFIVLALP